MAKIFRVNVTISYDETFYILADSKNEAEDILNDSYLIDADDIMNDIEFSTKEITSETYSYKNIKDEHPWNIDGEEDKETIEFYIEGYDEETKNKKTKEWTEKHTYKLFE